MKSILTSLSFAVVIIAAALIFTQNNGAESISDGSNVSVVDGTQYIEISAKGGYSPQTTLAQAGVPTVLNISTNGTYDCSTALVIPDLNFSEFLPSSGITAIDIPAQTSGTTIQGLCSMGMYNFEIEFE